MSDKLVYHPPDSKKNSGASFGGALTLAALIFLALPLTQFIGDVIKPPPTIISDPPRISPPQEIPPDPPPEDDIEPEPEKPELEEENKPIDLAMLDAYLNVGVGDSLVPGKGFGLSDFPNAIKDMGIFDITDMDRKPRRLVAIAPIYPFQFKREGIEGWVKLVIILDERGNVIKATIKESSHKEFEKPSIEAVMQWKFEPGTMNGKPVKVRRLQPLSYKLN